RPMAYRGALVGRRAPISCIIRPHFVQQVMILIGRLFKKLSGKTEPAREPSPRSGSRSQRQNSNKTQHSHKVSQSPEVTAPEQAAGIQGEKSKRSRTRSRGRRNRQRGSGASKQSGTPWDISQFPVPEEAGKTRFHDFELENDLMHAIADLKFDYCSPIQAQSLPLALQGKDVVGK